MSDTNSTDNDNWQLGKKPTITQVDRLAKELCLEYDNLGFFRWYCRVINVLGVSRVKEIQARFSDTEGKAKLFSQLANEEVESKLGRDKYNELKKKYGWRKKT
jgi:hypothetical protein